MDAVLPRTRKAVFTRAPAGLRFLVVIEKFFGLPQAVAMRILVAPDKFKGSLTAVEAAEAIRRGLLAADPHADVRMRPIADGGEGTAEAICQAGGGEWVVCRARGPLGDPVEARYAWLPGGIAVIDMSEASGIGRISASRRDPLRATTFGTGEMIADAARRGARKILIGLGGSATNDGGCGIAAALGFRFLAADGTPMDPVPQNLPSLDRILAPDALDLPELIALCDVQNPLLGTRGATHTYGPQKGAVDLQPLEDALHHLAGIAARDLGRDCRDVPGAGAAGGTGFGLMCFLGASFRPGFEMIAGVLGLEKEMAQSDLVITGEGRLDAQTLEGKGPLGVAGLARRCGKRVVAFAGCIDADPRLREIFDDVVAITPPGLPLGEALRNAGHLLESAAARLMLAPS